jgi:hypothetical protein
MRKKPPRPALKLVSPIPTDPNAPPADLDQAGADLWRGIMAEFVIDDAPSRQTLLQICHVADLAAAAHARGLVKEELAARMAIARAIHRMGFDVEATREKPGRPGGVFVKSKG